MTTCTCAHCGQACGDFAGGYASVSDVPGPVRHLCHPNDPGRPDCYRRVTVYHEPLGALRDADPKPAGVEGALAASRAALLDRLAEVARNLPAQEDEPGAAQELVRETADWAPYRAAVNRMTIFE